MALGSPSKMVSCLIALYEYIFLQGPLRPVMALFLRASILKDGSMNGLRGFLINQKKTFLCLLPGNEVMRWYVNDISLQGQYIDIRTFEALLRAIIRLRTTIENVRIGLFTARTFREGNVSPTLKV